MTFGKLIISLKRSSSCNTVVFSPAMRNKLSPACVPGCVVSCGYFMPHASPAQHVWNQHVFNMTQISIELLCALHVPSIVEHARGKLLKKTQFVCSCRRILSHARQGHSHGTDTISCCAPSNRYAFVSFLGWRRGSAHSSLMSGACCSNWWHEHIQTRIIVKNNSLSQQSKCSTSIALLLSYCVAKHFGIHFRNSANNSL